MTKQARAVLKMVWFYGFWSGQNVPNPTKEKTIDRALSELREMMGAMKKAYRFTSNPLKNGQNCKAYKTKIRNEAISDVLELFK